MKTSVQLLLDQLTPELRYQYQLWVRKFYTCGDKFSKYLIRQGYSGNYPHTFTGSFEQDKIVKEIDLYT
jgi:hypothetical protein